VNDKGEACFSAWTPLPGKVQTVPRAEAYAFLSLLRNLAPNAIARYFIDNLQVKDTFDKGKARATLSLNGDLYKEMFLLIETKNLSVTMTWMPSHTDKDSTKKKPSWLTQWHVDGNNIADVLADQAAEEHSLPYGIAAKVIKRCHLLASIQSKIIAVVKLLPKRKHAPRTSEPAPLNQISSKKPDGRCIPWSHQWTTSKYIASNVPTRCQSKQSISLISLDQLASLITEMQDLCRLDTVSVTLPIT
jgi:hypothetical protein